MEADRNRSTCVVIPAHVAVAVLPVPVPVVVPIITILQLRDLPRHALRARTLDCGAQSFVKRGEHFQDVRLAVLGKQHLVQPTTAATATTTTTTATAAAVGEEPTRQPPRSPR